MPLTRGARLGPYEIGEVIVSTEFDEVYRARDTRLGRDVAVRVLPSHLAADPASAERFEEETRSVASLSHPNILALHDLGKEQSTGYAVMELPEGETLRAHQRETPMAWKRAVQIGIEVAEGLSAAHQKGIVHGGLRPEVILITPGGHVKILDFGLVGPQRKFAELIAPVETVPEDSPTTPFLPVAVDIASAARYLAPEQIRGKGAEPASDIWALGCVLHEMLTGKPAFDRGELIETVAGILHASPASLLRDDVPREVAAITLRCMEKESENRFQSARDLAFALSQTLGLSAGPSRKRPKGRGSVSSLAVLPLTNETNDANLDYLSDGISEVLIDILSHIPRLRVMARSTVFRFKGSPRDPLEIAKELGVAAVLLGRLSPRGELLDIRCELVDVANGWQLWGQQYVRELSDLTTMQQEIAGDIARALRLRLSGEQKRRMRRQPTSNSEAYQLYFRGRYHWNRRSPDSLPKAIEFFQKAIEADPRFALAYSGLADCYNVMGNFSLLPPRVAYPKGRAAALQALAIDDELAEPHSSLAFATLYFDWNPLEAERGFLRSLELNPGYSIAHQWYAICLSAQGRCDEAVARAQAALEVDPLSLSGNMTLGWMLYESRRYAEAIEQETRTLELDPMFAPARFFLGVALAQSGEHDRAIEEFERALATSGRNPRALGGLGYVFGRSGRHADARAILEELGSPRGQYVPAYEIASVHIGLGEAERAVDALERAWEEHSGWLPWLGVDPVFDSLRGHSRFEALVARVKSRGT